MINITNLKLMNDIDDFLELPKKNNINIITDNEIFKVSDRAICDILGQLSANMESVYTRCNKYMSFEGECYLVYCEELNLNGHIFFKIMIVKVNPNIINSNTHNEEKFINIYESDLKNYIVYKNRQDNIDIIIEIFNEENK